MVQLAAALGRTFSFGLLAAVSPLGDEELHDALSKLIEAGLLYRDGGTPDVSYGFKQTLMRDAAYQSLLKNTRQQYHARIAGVLEERHPDTAESEPEVLAHHYTEAGLPKQAVRYWGKAGVRALATYGHEEALGHFQRGLAAKEGQPMDAETAALQFALGRAQAATLERHELGEAVASLRRAFDYYAEAGDVARAIVIAGYPLPHLTEAGTGAAQLIERALALVPADSHEAGRLLSRYGSVMGIEEGDYEGAQDAFGRALAIAKREGDAALEMETLVGATSVDFAHLRFRETVDKSPRAIELALRAGDLQAELSARYCATASLRDMGDLEGMRLHAAAILAPAERLRHRFWLAGALWLNENVFRLKGDWGAAREFSDRGLAWAPKDYRLLSTRAHLEYEAGDFDQGQAYLERLLEVTRLTPPGLTPEHPYAAILIPVVSRITGVIDRFDVTRSAADTVLSSPSATPRRVGIARAGLALMAVQRGDVEAAGEHYSALEPARGTLAAPGISGDRLLGLLAQTMGKLDDAAAHFEDALAFCRAGHRPEYAWSAYDSADALLQRNGPGDRMKASSLLDEALSISRELGMNPLMERVLSRQDNLKE